MTKNTLNLILLAIVIALTAFIYFSEKKNTELERLTNIVPDSISSIIITRKNNTVTLSKQDNNQWEITQPTLVPANDFRITSLLKLINAPVHNKYSMNEIELNNIGLEATDTGIQFDQQMIYFGVINPITNLRYIRMNDSIYTIEDVYFPLINSHYSTLVSLNLLPSNSQIEKLTLLNQTIEQDENNRWQSSIGTSPDNVSKILDRWKNAQAFGVHKYMQRDNLGKIAVTLKSPNNIMRFVVTDKEPWLIIARPDIGLEYHLEIESYAQLIEPVD